MRKSVAISLLLIYIIASSGVAINVHYSSGKLKSINLVLDKSSKRECTQNKVASNTNSNYSHKAAPVTKSNNFSKDVLNCVSIVSQGFFQAYDDADTIPECACVAGTAQRPSRISMLVNEG
jgi:hypothetical protein